MANLKKYKGTVEVDRVSTRTLKFDVECEAESKIEALRLSLSLAADKAGDADYSTAKETDVRYNAVGAEVDEEGNEDKPDGPEPIVYALLSPDGLLIGNRHHATIQSLMRAAAHFVASFQPQGYYMDSRQCRMTLADLASGLSHVEVPASRSIEQAYEMYKEECADTNAVPLSHFMHTPECADLMLDEEEEEAEEDTVWVLWVSSRIVEEFPSREDAQDEINAMESRGCRGVLYTDKEEAAKDALS